MKRFGLLTFLVVLLASNAFAEVTFSPSNNAPLNTQQIKIAFPEAMMNVDGAFTVQCVPEMAGDGYWADNNTTWVYNFNLPKDEYGDPRPMAGGSVCSIEQAVGLKSVTDKVFAQGSLQHKFTVEGPVVSAVYPLPGFNRELREKNPVMMIVFNGDIDRSSLYSGQSILIYKNTETNPSDAMEIAPVPQAESDKLFDVFKSRYSWRFDDFQLEKDNTRWAIVTVNRDLIEGAELTLLMSGVTSAYNPNVQAAASVIDLKVRDAFKAEVRCATNEDNSSYCRPESSPAVSFNGEVKWQDAKQVKIEYVPADAENGQTVTASPKSNSVVSSWAGWALSYFNVDIDNQEAMVTSLDFSHVQVAPNTEVIVTFPAGLTDRDGRPLNKKQHALNYGSFTETIKLAEGLSVIERTVPANRAMPILVMNLNQELTFKTPRSQSGEWVPVTDVPTMIDLIAGNNEMSWKSKKNYQSPFDIAGVKTTTEKIKLTGDINQKQLITVPFAQTPQGVQSGLYGVEMSSELAGDESPKMGLMMVTDLAVHMKKGMKETLVWVTSLSTGQAMPGAQISVYGCDKNVKSSGVTDAEGLYIFNNNSIPNCEGSALGMINDSAFFVAASTATDIALTSSLDTVYEGNALYAPGVEYYSSDFTVNEAYLHAIIGVNLVKPGQTVPVKIVANVPTALGFRAAKNDELPASVNVQYMNNPKVSYKFDLDWKNGAAEFQWKVPKSAELGSYRISYLPAGSKYTRNIGSSDIDVSEFKIPLMSANLNLPQGPIVQPSELKVAGSVQYSNGVGAKDLDVDVSFYFSPANFAAEGYEGFNFAAGKYQVDGKEVAQNLGLPSSQNTASVSDVVTDKDGTLSVDIASELFAKGQTLSELLAQAKQPYNLVVRMRYQDQMGEFQTLSSSRQVYNSGSYVGASVTEGTPELASLNVVTVGLDGKPYTNLSDIDLTVYQVKANIVGEELFGGYIKNNVNYEMVKTDWQAQCQSAENGVANCSAAGLEFGSYVFAVTAKSSQQNTYAKFTVDQNGNVGGDYGYNGGYQSNDLTLSLSADKENYEGGESAELKFESPFADCTALVSIERSEVMEAFVDTQACANGYVTVPVESAYAPNIFASVYLTTGRSGMPVSIDQMDLGKPSFVLGYSNLKIDWANYAADVEVSLDKEEYKPGETAQVTVDVAAQQGNLTNASVTLVVVEEKILEMKQNNTTDLLSAMMGLRDHTIETMNLYKSINSAAVEEAVLAEAVVESGAKGGEEGGSGSELETFKRKLFDALVTWQNDIPVVNGKAQTSFKLNDSLTKFKVIAVVQDSVEKFGSGAANYVSAQEVQTYPNMPPVSRTGDVFPVTVTLQNNGKQDSQLTVTVSYKMLDANGNVVDAGTLSNSQTVESASSKPITVDNLSVSDKVSSINYSVVVTDANGTIVDQLTPEAQRVLPAIPLSVQDEYMVQMEKAQETFSLNKNPQAIAGQGKIDTKVFSSLVESTRAIVQKSIEESTYGDFTLENRLIKALVSGNGLSEVYAEMIAQLDDEGMLKYYSGSSTGSFWMTADMLSLIGAYGAADAMPDSLKSTFVTAMEKALKGELGEDYLAQNDSVAMYSKVKALNAMNGIQPETAQEYAAAVLAPVEALTLDQWPVSALMEMSIAKSAFDGGQFAQSKLFTYTKDALIILNNKSAKLNDVSTFSWWGYSDETIGTAKLVKALSADARVSGAKSADNYLDNLVAGLVNANQAGAWYNMRTKAWVVAAMMEFAKTYESTAVSGKTEITNSASMLSNVTVWNKEVQEGGMSTDWPADSATVTVNHSGEGQPWVSVQASSAVKLTAANYKGIQVVKSTKNITSQDGVYRAGDMIEVNVKLTVNGPMQHVVLFDPIPGGANILGDGWGAYSMAQKSYAGYKVYFRALGSGTTEVSYQYQLNNPGQFNVSPTRAEALYEPGFFGEVPNATIKVGQ